ncbi:yippee-like protein [Aspergillus affinis]|uniref:yippee-like protein n=1 Tax=Aspergillus affinis TaxID=1070780 RepID=UPI0022FDB3DA|nr:yippee-like protein [Aspergillus affinis]KAI9041191.1 yippee-like protein [Aspergillus affinis]
MNQSLQGFAVAPCSVASQKQDVFAETKKEPLLAHHAEQFFFQDELALLVFLAGLVRLVVFPSYRFSALPTGDVPHNMPTGRHATLDSLRLRYVHDVIEKEQASKQTTRGGTHPTDDIIVVSKVRFALLASEDFVGGEVHVVCKTHYDLSSAFFPLPPVEGTPWYVSSNKSKVGAGDRGIDPKVYVAEGKRTRKVGFFFWKFLLA